MQPEHDDPLDRRRLQAMGVLLPIRLQSLALLPGHHALGRAGEGMRFLRSRPFEPGQDNPRDIDKYSPKSARLVNEWEAEAQATAYIHVDLSASMTFAPCESIRNLAVLQLTYSLWRAADRVKAYLGFANGTPLLAEKNLRTQVEALATHLQSGQTGVASCPFERVRDTAGSPAATGGDLHFIVSDFLSPAGFDTAMVEAAWRTTVRRAAAHLVPVIVSFELPRQHSGMTRLIDPETGARRSVLLTPGRVNRMNDREANRAARTIQLFRRLGVDSLLVRRDVDVYPELAKLARQRRRRGK